MYCKSNAKRACFLIAECRLSYAKIRFFYNMTKEAHGKTS